MTWRELIKKLESYGDKALDLPACIYIDEGSAVNYDGLTDISSVTTYYLDYPSYKETIPVNEENCLMMTVADKF